MTSSDQNIKTWFVMWKLDVERLYEQIQNDEEHHRLVWKPKLLKDNIFEVIAVAKKVFSIKRLKGKPFRIDNETFAWNYE